MIDSKHLDILAVALLLAPFSWAQHNHALTPVQHGHMATF
jgi:hypothetical protein